MPSTQSKHHYHKGALADDEVASAIASKIRSLLPSDTETDEEAAEEMMPMSEEGEDDEEREAEDALGEEDDEDEIDIDNESDYDSDDELLTQLLVSEDGETIPDVLAGVRKAIESLTEAMAKQNKILFKISQLISP